MEIQNKIRNRVWVYVILCYAILSVVIFTLIEKKYLAAVMSSFAAIGQFTITSKQLNVFMATLHEIEMFSF